MDYYRNSLSDHEPRKHSKGSKRSFSAALNQFVDPTQTAIPMDIDDLGLDFFKLDAEQSHYPEIESNPSALGPYFGSYNPFGVFGTCLGPDHPVTTVSNGEQVYAEVAQDIDGNWYFRHPETNVFIAPIAWANNGAQMGNVHTTTHLTAYHQAHDPSPITRNTSLGQRTIRPKRTERVVPEMPAKDPNRPWLRVNCKSRSNTRAAKTNQFGNGEYPEITVHPLTLVEQNGTWMSQTGNVFEYNKWGELYGVSKHTDEIEDFLFNHPFNRQPTQNRKLILWIQKAPGDSAKRVETASSDKCKFSQCPCRVYKSRTINVGHFRVAFDEQWAEHGENRNPMHVAGYAHLYCMERFLDFKAVCQYLDVRPDDRELPREPNGEWAASLGQASDETKTAQSFIDFCKLGNSQTLMDTWLRYPRHSDFARGARKPHDFTLTRKMNEAKVKNTVASKMRMMEKRGRNSTMFFVNMGDLQMQVDGRRNRGNSIRGCEADDGDNEEENLPARRRRSHRHMRNLPVRHGHKRQTGSDVFMTGVEPAPRRTTRSAASGRRKVYDRESESSGNESDAYYARSSRRNKRHRPNEPSTRPSELPAAATMEDQYAAQPQLTFPDTFPTDFLAAPVPQCTFPPPQPLFPTPTPIQPPNPTTFDFSSLENPWPSAAPPSWLAQAPLLAPDPTQQTLESLFPPGGSTGFDDLFTVPMSRAGPLDDDLVDPAFVGVDTDIDVGLLDPMLSEGLGLS